MQSPSRLLRRGAIVGLVLIACACTENDELLVENAAVTQLVLVDSGLLSQSVFSPFDRIQVAEWVVTRAQLDVDDSLVDLLVGEDCTFTDTVFASSFADGPCADGIVIEWSDDAFDIELYLTLDSMGVRRAEPVPLPDDGNFDGDGVRNQDDNCPLLDNEDQADNDHDGVGNLCTVPPDGSFAGLTDSDRDSVPDLLDNCVWIANPDQADSGVGADGPPDGIGDLCAEESALVRDPGGRGSFELIFPTTSLLQTGFNRTYLTVDFDSREALSCDWAAGTCEIDPSEVELCIRTSFSEAQQGC